MKPVSDGGGTKTGVPGERRPQWPSGKGCAHASAPGIKPHYSCGAFSQSSRTSDLKLVLKWLPYQVVGLACLGLVYCDWV